MDRELDSSAPERKICLLIKDSLSLLLNLVQNKLSDLSSVGRKYNPFKSFANLNSNLQGFKLHTAEVGLKSESIISVVPETSILLCLKMALEKEWDCNLVKSVVQNRWASVFVPACSIPCYSRCGNVKCDHQNVSVLCNSASWRRLGVCLAVRRVVGQRKINTPKFFSLHVKLNLVKLTFLGRVCQFRSSSTVVLALV